LVEKDTDAAPDPVTKNMQIRPNPSFQVIPDLTPDSTKSASSKLLFYRYCAFYFRVDKDKGYIDLSKRRVSKEDIERCTEKYSKVIENKNKK
jgi:hypothetical protein